MHTVALSAKVWWEGNKRKHMEVGEEISKFVNLTLVDQHAARIL
jgi:hypothetical protein